MEWTDSALRQFLLGLASPEAAERIENRLLEDDELFAALQSAEDDLFDGFSRGRMTPDERTRFLERFGHHADRLRFAAALARGSAPARVPAIAKRPWIPLAAAALLVLAAGTIFMRLEAPAPVPAPQRQTATPAQPAAFAITLALGASRAPGAASPVTIPAGTAEVVLNVRLDPDDRYDTYALELRGAGDRQVWSGARLKASTVDGQLTVSARIPVAALPAGSYELAVRGGSTDLGYVPMTVRWSP